MAESLHYYFVFMFPMHVFMYVDILCVSMVRGGSRNLKRGVGAGGGFEAEKALHITFPHVWHATT